MHVVSVPIMSSSSVPDLASLAAGSVSYDCSMHCGSRYVALSGIFNPRTDYLSAGTCKFSPCDLNCVSTFFLQPTSNLGVNPFALP